MRLFLSVLFICLNLLPALSQSRDTLRLQSKSGSKFSSLIDIQDLTRQGFNYYEDHFKGHWAGVHIGINGFAKADYSNYPADQDGFLDNKLFWSNVLDLNLLQWSIGMQSSRNTIGLVTGVGLGLQTYRLNNNTSIREDADGKIYPVSLYYEDNQKSKFSSVYLGVPLLLEFQVPINHYANRLYLSAGIQAGNRLNSHTKIKYRKDGKKEKLKSPDDFSMRDMRYSAMVRLGYRRINVFATYDLVPLFKDTKGPEVYPFSVGLSLLSF